MAAAAACIALGLGFGLLHLHSQALLLTDGSEPNTANFVTNYVQGIWQGWLAREGVSLPVAVESRAWFNPALAPTAQALGDVPLSLADVDDASARLERFASYSGELQPHFAYGALNHADYAQAHVLHLYNHLSLIRSA